MNEDVELYSSSDGNSDSETRSQSETSDSGQGIIARHAHQNQEMARIIASIYGLITEQYIIPMYKKMPHHTSALTGEDWVKELLTGHPDRIRCALGVRLPVFLELCQYLRANGYQISRSRITLEEQLAIFLHACVTGLTSRHLAERFQHSHTTISKYFIQMLRFFSQPPFYTDLVRLPADDDPVPNEIIRNPKFYPFFLDALGAVDGTHIACTPGQDERAGARNRKGFYSQNCLFACSFDFRFLYVLSGWEGSATDATVWNNARLVDFRVPVGKYYLADAGFGSCPQLLVPYRNERYHLQEFARGGARPQNARELYNLRHSSARNVIERIFGVLKRHFRILLLPPKYKYQHQVRIPPSLAALHNFNRKYDPLYHNELEMQPEVEMGDVIGSGELGTGPPNREERDEAAMRRDMIAQAMWDQYQAVLTMRGAAGQF